MKKRFPPTAILSLLILLISFASSSATRGAGFLHTQGEDIVDESGKKITLRGVGLGNWLLPEGYMWKFGDFGDRPRHIEKIVSDLIGQENAEQFWKQYRRQYVSQKDIARIAELGFNSVRIPLNARLFLSEGDNPQFLNEGFSLLNNLVAWCKANNLYLIIDMHAAPGGQTGHNIDDSVDDQPRLFMDPKNQDRLVDLWVKIATRYKDEPAVAAYDLLNEPLPQRTGAAEKYGKLLEPLYKRITQAIREVDKKHMITVEGMNWANDWSIFTNRFDDNLVYQFHYYCRAYPAELKTMRDFVTQRGRLGAPVWVGETGERNSTIYWATTDYLESNNIGWSFWPWKKMDAGNAPYSITPPAGWDKIVAFSAKGEGERPSSEAAQKIFNELLINIEIDDCTYYPDVVNALFHGLPARIEAENYGQEGPGKSYSLKDTSKPSPHYRKSEPVPIEMIDPADKSGETGQAIQLTSGEWTRYNVNSPDARSYSITIKVKATNGLPAAFRISINGNNADHSQKVAVAEEGWLELKLNSVDLPEGASTLKLSAESGTVSVDWISFQ